MNRTASVLAALSLLPLGAGCSSGEADVPPPPAYCVVDLSGGPKASSYPVTTLDELPADFNSKAYKTDQLILKWIEPGTFKMGQILEATPIHEVTFSKGYYLGLFELSQAQWQKVMGPGSFHFAGKATHPAEMISWEDLRGAHADHDWPASKKPAAESFMGRLSARTGGAYRFDLPTEAQWEYACRAGTETRWSFGNDRELADEHVWTIDNSDDATQAVGTRKPNPWGLFDMHGNVWEWCLDRFGSYPAEAQTDPTGYPSGWHRIWRGGGWDCSLDLGRSAHRNGGEPSDRAFHVGCRVAMSPQ